MPAASQIELLYAATQGLLPHDTPSERVHQFKREFPAYLDARDPEGVKALLEKDVITDTFAKTMARAAKEWLAQSGAVK